MTGSPEIAKVAVLIPPVIEFVDIAGLVKGASQGEGLGNKFLSHIREVDALLHVVRCFEDPDIVHVTGSIEPIRDIEIITTELILADLEAVHKRLEKISRDVKRGDKHALLEAHLLEAVRAHLDSGKPANTLPTVTHFSTVGLGIWNAAFISRLLPTSTNRCRVWASPKSAEL